MRPSHSATYEQLVNYAQAWREIDPDSDTRSETTSLLEASTAEQHQALRDRFTGRLNFGTAGLRGRMGAGPQRMSTLLIRWVTLGLGDYLLEQIGGGRIVIGYDGRDRSDLFAREAAHRLTELGFDVELSEQLCPTPLLAFSVVYRKAIAGIMVTASHNPPLDNGFKVYWSNGAQIVPPQDQEISAAIDRVQLDRLRDPQPTHTQGQLSSLDTSFSGDLGQAYWSEVSRARLPSPPSSPRRLRVVYTAMHGVGAEWFKAVISQHPEIELLPVKEQCDPDPRFPTVAFPNPEEPGALDLALALAEREQADLILAHDPDADRLAVVARDKQGVMRPFSGDQVGALIAHELFTRLDLTEQDMVATTIVSSSLLSEMARTNGLQCAETLTGFKWIANRAIEHQAGGGRFLFGYEEAIGYSMFGIVRDKDGVSAGLFVAEMALRALGEGRSLWAMMHEIYERYGLYLSSLVSRVREGTEGAAEIKAWMKGLRANPPQTIAGIKVTEAFDFADAPAPLTGNVLRYRLNDGSRVIVRPSGTEPKIKMYFEVCVDQQAHQADSPLQIARDRLSALESGLMSLLDSPR